MSIAPTTTTDAPLGTAPGEAWKKEPPAFVYGGATREDDETRLRAWKENEIRDHFLQEQRAEEDRKAKERADKHNDKDKDHSEDKHDHEGHGQVPSGPSGHGRHAGLALHHSTHPSHVQLERLHNKVEHTQGAAHVAAVKKEQAALGIKQTGFEGTQTRAALHRHHIGHTMG